MGKIEFGFENATGLRIAIEWMEGYPTDGPIGGTWGAIQLWVGDTLVWGAMDSSSRPVEGISWSLLEILEFLGSAWVYLVEEEQYPIVFEAKEEPRHLGELWSKAKLRLNRLPSDAADREDDRLRDFLAVHDFSEAFQGACPPSKLLLLRQGNEFIAATPQREWTIPFQQTLSVLKALADAILLRISGFSDRRSQLARERWESRNRWPPCCETISLRAEGVLAPEGGAE